MIKRIWRAWLRWCGFRRELRRLESLHGWAAVACSKGLPGAWDRAWAIQVEIEALKQRRREGR